MILPLPLPAFYEGSQISSESLVCGRRWAGRWPNQGPEGSRAEVIQFISITFNLAGVEGGAQSLLFSASSQTMLFGSSLIHSIKPATCKGFANLMKKVFFLQHETLKQSSAIWQQTYQFIEENNFIFSQLHCLLPRKQQREDHQAGGRSPCSRESSKRL